MCVTHFNSGVPQILFLEVAVNHWLLLHMGLSVEETKNVHYARMLCFMSMAYNFMFGMFII